MDKDSIDKANAIFNKGAMPELYEFIKPFLEKNDPYALYLSSRFSLPEWNESEDEYDKRYVDSLTKAAAENVVEAMYRLSALYFVGDTVGINIETGKRYLDRAMELGYGPAKLTVGINLNSGSNGYPKDRIKSLQLISDAEKDGVEGASDVLAKLS